MLYNDVAFFILLVIYFVDSLDSLFTSGSDANPKIEAVNPRNRNIIVLPVQISIALTLYNWNHFSYYNCQSQYLSVCHHREGVIDPVCQKWSKDDKHEADADPDAAGEPAGPEADDAHDYQHAQGGVVSQDIVTRGCS